MKVRFHPEAVAEFEAAALFYEEQRSGLGGRFVVAIEAALLSIQETPDRWPVLEVGIHRRRVRKFPYVLLYAHVSEAVMIVRSHAHAPETVLLAHPDFKLS